jgi:hypothetical protein
MGYISMKTRRRTAPKKLFRKAWVLKQAVPKLLQAIQGWLVKSLAIAN